jgi:tripartite-type tricarboxylate transporter receptor subunit TctC
MRTAGRRSNLASPIGRPRATVENRCSRACQKKNRGGIMIRLPLAITLAATLAALARIEGATAQDYPSRPITLVVGYPAGGPTDGVARMLASDMSARFGQRIVVENKGGAGGMIAAAALAKSPPDGYTLLFTGVGALSYYRTLYKSLSYDPGKDIAPVAMIGAIPDLLLASPKLPVTTLKELIAWAKANPGKLNIGDSGAGTVPHIMAAAFAQKAGIQVTHVHYRGAAGSVTDMMGGQIEAAAAAYLPQFVSLKALAVSWHRRMAALPSVPTFRENGYDLVIALSIGLSAPAGTPAAAIDKVNAAVNDFLKGPRGREIHASLGLEVIGGSPADMRKFLDEESARLEPVIKAAKITIE